MLSPSSYQGPPSFVRVGMYSCSDLVRGFTCCPPGIVRTHRQLSESVFTACDLCHYSRQSIRMWTSVSSIGNLIIILKPFALGMTLVSVPSIVFQ
jgi:hypothetical protein